MMKKIYFPNLDGLRFFAFLAVFLFHSLWTELPGIKGNNVYQLASSFTSRGFLGVNFFFVLSGFLITYLLLTERDSTHRIDVKSFYMRRILRIWPLYYTVLLIGFFVLPYVQGMLGQTTKESGHIIYYIFFINNFDVLPTYGSVSVLWSIAIEEQFYLVWPLLFSIVPRQWYYLVFPVLIGFGLFLLPFIPLEDLHSSTFVNMIDLTIGGWAAYLAFSSKKFIGAFTRFSRTAIILFYVLGFALIVFLQPILMSLALEPKVAYIVSKIFFCLFFAFVILEQNYSVNSFYKASNLKQISKLGLYTYSLYMLHMLCITVVNKFLDIFKFNTNVYEVLIVQTLLSFIASVIMAWISYNFLEKKFLNLKKRFENVKTAIIGNDLIEHNF